MWKAILAALQAAWKWVMFKSRVENKLDSITRAIEDNNRRVLRLEILEFIRKKDKMMVYALYDEYKRMGGDSWMDDVFLRWKANQEKK